MTRVVFFCLFLPTMLFGQEVDSGILEPSQSAVWSLIRVVVALTFVVALIYLILNKGLASWLKKNQTSQNIRILERQALDTRKALYLVQISNKKLLIGASDNNLNLICELSGESKEPPNNQTQAFFLKKQEQSYDA